MTGLLWAAEFALEASGACFSFRKHKPLFFYLAFRALSDVALFSVRHMFGDYVYGWAYWGQQAGAALLLCWLCVAIMARMVGDSDYGPHGVILCAGGVLAALLGISRSHSVPGAILGAAVNFDLLLGLAMLVGLISQKVQLTAPWTVMAWGVCIQLGWQGLMRGIAHYDERALAWLPLGAIGALGVWTVAVWPRREHKIVTIDATIPPEVFAYMEDHRAQAEKLCGAYPRIGPESVTVVEEGKWVM